MPTKPAPTPFFVSLLSRCTCLVVRFLQSAYFMKFTASSSTLETWGGGLNPTPSHISERSSRPPLRASDQKSLLLCNITNMEHISNCYAPTPELDLPAQTKKRRCPANTNETCLYLSKRLEQGFDTRKFTFTSSMPGRYSLKSYVLATLILQNIILVVLVAGLDDAGCDTPFTSSRELQQAK
jgi:hypothetical protein